MAFVAGWDEGVLGMQVGEVARLKVKCKSFPCSFLSKNVVSSVS